MSSKPTIFMDKSYLQGATKGEIAELCGCYKVLMTENLFFEILTSTREKTRACFAKLPACSNPVELVPNMGPLIRREVDSGGPCGPVENYRQPFEWFFNPELADGSFQLAPEQAAGVSAWRDAEEEFVDDFLESVALAARTIPELAEAKPSDRLQVAFEICQKIATNADVVRDFYEGTKPDFFPPAEALDEQWAIYRWYQVNLAAAAEFFARHGAAPEARRKKIRNERLDLDHTAVALLVGCLASRDNTMVRRFRTFLPAGKVVQ